jgi:hypothetical protein
LIQLKARNAFCGHIICVGCREEGPVRNRQTILGLAIMRIFSLIAVVMFVSSLAAPAWAGMKEVCEQNYDPDLKIGGCTAAIRSGQWQGKGLATAYYNHGNAYSALGEHPEYPTRMDDLLRALGADPVDWSYKTECCGGALGVSLTPIGQQMSRKVLENARECGAEAVVTMCPMCQMNLDARQPQIGLDPAMPVLHATQLAALEKNVIDPRPLRAAKVP